MPTGNFSVVVKRSDTNAPIGGATVTLLRLPPLTARTDSSGVATFENLEAGPVTIGVVHSAFRSKGQVVTVQPDQTSMVTLLLDPATDVYFAIYYKVKDNAFKWAADTWKKELKAKPVDPGSSKIVMHEVETAAQFKAAWQDIQNQSKGPGVGVKEGHVFSHASKGEGEDGLEFKGGGGEDGTISKGELQSLPALPWLDDGLLVLHGCNTGLAASRGWTPAEVIAKAQKVRTIGQAGYAYFSQNYTTYVEWHSSYPVVYLWAYHRAKNGMAGGGGRMPGKEFRP